MVLLVKKKVCSYKNLPMLIMLGLKKKDEESERKVEKENE